MQLPCAPSAVSSTPAYTPLHPLTPHSGAGCPLLPNTSQLLSHARVYWLLTAAAWLPAFVGKGVLGFFLGARNRTLTLTLTLILTLTLTLRGCSPSS